MRTGRNNHHTLRVPVRADSQFEAEAEHLGLLKPQVKYQGTNLPLVQFALDAVVSADMRNQQVDQQKRRKHDRPIRVIRVLFRGRKYAQAYLYTAHTNRFMLFSLNCDIRLFP